MLSWSLGVECSGPLRCYYCGSPCDGSHSTHDHVADTFTGRTGVACPASLSICKGCVLCLREDATVPLCDGTDRHIAKAAMRACSWVITATRATAALKSHIPWLRGVCLNPPPAPRAITIAVSGQKQLLYRTPVDLGGETVAVQVEEETVRYRPCDLAERLALASSIVPWSGKPALLDPLAGLRATTEKQAESFDQWSRVMSQPLSRLAAFLCPSREELSRE